MKPVPPALQAHLDGELTTLAELVRLTRADGVVLGFTTHDADLVVDGITYRADGSLTIRRLDAATLPGARSTSATGLLASGFLEAADIEAGLYDHARLDVFLVNWADVAQGVVPLQRGWIGEVTRMGSQYVAEWRNFHDLLRQRVGEVYTPECRYDHGDSRCGVDLDALAVTGTVTSAADALTFTDTARTEADGVFACGALRWTSGANEGITVEVRAWDAATKTFGLWLPMPHPIAPGDAYRVHPGCDKRLATCANVFNNVVRFGGFPYLPGVGRIMKYPQAR